MGTLDAPGSSSYQSRFVSRLNNLTFSGTQFDVDGAIVDALSGLKVNLTVDSGLKIDDCESSQSQTPSSEAKIL